MTEFEEYQLVHKFIHPDEPLKKWISADNFTNHYKDDWNETMNLVNRILNYTAESENDVNGDYSHFYDCVITSLTENIEDVYRACVNFLKIYM